MKKGIVFEINNDKAVIITPEGEFLSVSSDSSWQVGSEVSFNRNTLDFVKKEGKDTTKQGIAIKKVFLTAIAACLLFFIVPFTLTSQASTYISIDINPSIELELKDSEVVNIISLNSDAKKVLASVSGDIIGKDLYTSTLRIIEATKELGYLKEQENLIVVGVCDDSGEVKSEEYEKFIEENLNDISSKVEVVVVDGTKEDKKIADEKEVSIGKYVIQKDKKDNGVEISDNELKKSSIKDLIEKTNKTNKDIDKIQNNFNTNASTKNSNKDKGKGNSNNSKNEVNQNHSNENNNSNIVNNVNEKQSSRDKVINNNNNNNNDNNNGNNKNIENENSQSHSNKESNSNSVNNANEKWNSSNKDTNNNNSNQNSDNNDNGNVKNKNNESNSNESSSNNRVDNTNEKGNNNNAGNNKGNGNKTR